MFNCKSVIFFMFFCLFFCFLFFYNLLFLCFISNINKLLNFVKKTICFFYIFFTTDLKCYCFCCFFCLATNNLQICFFHCLTVYKKTPYFFINSFSCVSVVLLFFIIIDTYTCKKFFIFVWFFCF